MFPVLPTLALFGTAALAAWEGALANNAQVGGLKFLGCANEIPGRALTGPSFSSDKMTVESCRDFCQAKNYWMSGVEAARECYCGKFIAKPAVFREPAACDMTCTGNNKQRCGGWGRVSIFNMTDYRGASAPASAGNYDRKSCYMEPQWDHALPTLVLADDTMTVEKCMTACGAAGFKYCGLEYGRECWGGNTLDPNLQNADDPSCAMQCDMPCPGNASQLCGGRATIAVYQKKGTKRDADDSDLDVDRVRAMKGRFIKVRRPFKDIERDSKESPERDVVVEVAEE